MFKSLLPFALVFSLIPVASRCNADFTGYTDRATFDAALVSAGFLNVSIIDFDSVADATTVADGSSFGGLTFDYGAGFAGESIEVVSTARSGTDTTSAPNYLGTSIGSVPEFQAGANDFSVTPTSKRFAFGMFIVVEDPLDVFDGDFSLEVGGNSIGLLESDLQATLGDGSGVFFLGVIDTDMQLGPISFVSSFDAEAAGLTYRIDDMITAVPEPSSLVLAGCLIPLALRRRRSPSRS